MISQTLIASEEASKYSTQYAMAIADIKEGLKSWRIWLLMSWQDIRLRYRRSTLGPFWITLSMAITISMTGFLYGCLFHFRSSDYFPQFASGMLIWSYLSASICEGSQIFIEAENYLRRLKLPYSIFIFRSVTRSFIIFLHNSVIFIPVMMIYHIPVTSLTLLALLGIMLIVYNACTVGAILAIFGTRYRDIPQVVNSLVQVIFFITPIMWTPNMLPDKYQLIVKLNPIAQFLEVVRKPLTGGMPSSYSLTVVFCISVFTTFFALFLFSRYRGRVAYWL